MINITDPRINNYLNELMSQDDQRLKAMEEKAAAGKFPIIDRQVGRFLQLMTYLQQPRLVVELGSGFGYSALWIARALTDGGQIVLTEYAEKNLDYARQVFAEEKLSERAVFRAGNALEIGQGYDNIDLLFMDLDKYLYPAALKVMLPRLATNGLLIADNVLWRGRVVETFDSKGTEPVKRFNEQMFQQQGFFTTIVPVGDGVLLARRIS